MNRDQILKKLEDNSDVIRSFGVRRLGIFGSYARAAIRQKPATWTSWWSLKKRPSTITWI